MSDDWPPLSRHSSAASDSASGKEHPLVASPESQTPALSAVKIDDFDSDEPQLGEESPGWENEDGSTGRTGEVGALSIYNTGNSSPIYTTVLTSYS